MGDDSETFDGTLKSYNDKNGFGFIECQTTKLKYGCDVFVHKTEGESVSVGSRVTFKVHLNKKGQPQANNLVAVAHNNLFKVEPGLQQTGDIQSAGSDGLSGPFLGRVKSNNPVNGYGFITCEETQAIYKADVYLNQTEGHGLEPGQEVYFQVQRNQQGKPQAVGVSVVSKKRSYDSMSTGQQHVQMLPTMPIMPMPMRKDMNWQSSSWQGGGLQLGQWQTGFWQHDGLFNGFVKSFNHEQGYGFINCDETWHLYHSDVFLHQNEASGLEVGSQVSFRVHLNGRGQPQANSVSAVGGVAKRAKTEADSRSAPEPLHSLPLFPDGHFTGMVKSYNATTGYGFLECSVTKGLFSQDVFLHKSQVTEGIDVGSNVSFQVRLNKHGQPQADNVVLELEKVS
jgi:cold shock CspA family protein